jgi:hypothetical protein
MDVVCNSVYFVRVYMIFVRNNLVNLYSNKTLKDYISTKELFTKIVKIRILCRIGEDQIYIY